MKLIRVLLEDYLNNHDWYFQDVFFETLIWEYVLPMTKRVIENHFK